MPTNMVQAAGIEPATPLEEGIAATMRLIDSPRSRASTVTTSTGPSESAPHPQAEDPEAAAGCASSPRS